MGKRIRLRIGTVLNDNRIDILSEDGGSLLHDLCRVIEQELSKAREDGSFTIEELEVIRELCNFEYEKYVALDLEDSKAVKEVGILKSILSKLKTK